MEYKDSQQHRYTLMHAEEREVVAVDRNEREERQVSYGKEWEKIYLLELDLLLLESILFLLICRLLSLHGGSG